MSEIEGEISRSLHAYYVSCIDLSICLTHEVIVHVLFFYKVFVTFAYDTMRILLSLDICNNFNYCPRLSLKRGHHSSICLSIRLSVGLSVTKTLTWLIFSEVFMIEH